MKKLFLLFPFLAVAFGAVAQSEIILGELADSLVSNASSVVRLDRTSVEVYDMTSADIRYTRAVTVLNRENPAAGWYSFASQLFNCFAKYVICSIIYAFFISCQ